MSHGTSTLPEAIDRLAVDTPEKTWIQFAASPEALENGELTSVNFKTLANAINRTAWYLAENIPQAGDLETTICYIAPSDIRYFIVACAATKARIKVCCQQNSAEINTDMNIAKLLLSSPRNNFEAHEALFQQTKCRTLLGPARYCQELSETYDMQHIDFLSMEEVLETEKVEPYPWNRSLEDVASEPFVILHTSGSTGQPKMVEVNHALIATIDAQQDLPEVNGRCVTSRMWKDRKLYAAMPLFHSAGFNVLAFSIFQGTQPVLGPSDQPPSVRTAERMLDMDVASAGLIPPSLLAEIVNEPDVLQKFSRWDSVSFGGGPLAESAMKAIFKHCKVLKLLGSTETFNLPELLPESEDELPYHYFHPSLGIDFRPEGTLHELVFVRNENSKHQGAFYTFPELEEYHMKDLYERHPTKEGLWKYRGRSDDIIVLSNGEKFNPRIPEEILSSNVAVQTALIVGSGREQPLLLVEPISGKTDPTELDLTEQLRCANDVLPAYGKIHHSHIHIAEAGSFLRSGKGEVRRGPTINELQTEIDAAYEAAEGHVGTNTDLDFSSSENLASSLVSVIIFEIMQGQDISPTEDLFAYGIDSLVVMSLTRSIKAGLRRQGVESACNVSPKLIYNQRTASNIASSILDGNERRGDAESQSREMQQVLQAHLEVLPEATHVDAAKATSFQQAYLLTGSTGSLGSYLLDSLVRRESTTKVICLNRPGSDSAKQKKIQQSRGLIDDFSRVDFVEGNMTEERFGLSEEQYENLKEATHIVHNAWQVNFNLPLAAFDDQLQACRRLIELANSAPHSVRVTFTSSIGAANYWSQIGNANSVPEAILDDFNAAESGYGQSKLLAEHLFEAANDRFGIPVTICRLGQIAGPVSSEKGMWNTQEWFPSLLLSSKAMGKLPDSLASMDRVDWIPVDILADILAMDVICGDRKREKSPSGDFEEPAYEDQPSSLPKIARSGPATPDSDITISSTPASSICSSIEALSTKSKNRLAVLHFLNPSTARWSDDFAPQVQRLLGEDVALVSFDQWVEDLSARAEENGAGEQEDLPAAKLVDFFQEIGKADSKRPVFCLEQSTKASEKLGALQAVSFEWLEHWWEQWTRVD